MKSRIILLFLFLAGNYALSGQAQPIFRIAGSIQQDLGTSMTEEEKIHYLINFLRHLQGSTFIRNGKEFTPDKAADHLNSKYEKHKKKVKTAHDFVDRLATFSKTKEPYQIRLSNGETIKCGDLLNKELNRIES